MVKVAKAEGQERTSSMPPLPPFRSILSQIALNSRPRTKLGNAISRSPKMRSGTLMRRPRKERGMISPYPTVVIAVEVGKEINELV